VLGRAEGVRGFHDIKRYPAARQIPGLVLFRWDAPLFFANAELFKQSVLDAAASAPAKARWMVVTAEPVTSVDVTAADALAELHAALNEAGIELCFAELKDPVKDKLKRFGLFTHIGEIERGGFVAGLCEQEVAHEARRVPGGNGSGGPVADVRSDRRALLSEGGPQGGRRPSRSP
jgi:MFS superfamily sulfate permease-like transporter